MSDAGRPSRSSNFCTGTLRTPTYYAYVRARPERCRSALMTRQRRLSHTSYACHSEKAHHTEQCKDSQLPIPPLTTMSATMVETVVHPVSRPPSIDLRSYDEEQVRLMEERCILITPEDQAYGEDSKKTCPPTFLSP